MYKAPRNVSPNLLFTAYFVFKVLPMIVSGLAIYLGYRLFIFGVTGQASLSIQNHTVSGQLINAAPGLFFAVGGLVSLIFGIIKGIHVDFDDRDESSSSGGRITARASHK